MSKRKPILNIWKYTKPKLHRGFEEVIEILLVDSVENRLRFSLNPKSGYYLELMLVEQILIDSDKFASK